MAALLPLHLGAQANPDRSLSALGARALALGGAFTAIADDATAISWNPAGLATLEKRELLLVGNLRFVQPDPRFEDATFDFASVQVSRTASPITFASFVMPMRIGGFSVATGIAYRAMHDWTRAEELRTYYSNGTESAAIKERHARTGGVYAFSPSVAVGVGRFLQVGATANVLTGQSDFQSTVTRSGSITSPGTTVTRSSAGDYRGTALEAGVLVRPTRGTRVGLRAALPYSRTSTSTSGSTSSTTRLDIPMTFSAGFAVLPADGHVFAIDVRLEPWSKAQLLTENGDSVLNAQPYAHDLTSFHVGYERNVDYRGTRVATRLGAFSKPTAFNDAEGNQIRGIGASIGRGWRGRRFGSDLTLSYTLFSEHARLVTGTGRYATVDQEVQMTYGVTVVLP